MLHLLYARYRNITHRRRNRFVCSADSVEAHVTVGANPGDSGYCRVQDV